MDRPLPSGEPAEETARGFRRFRARLRGLYHGRSPEAVRFRLTVLIIDLLLIVFFVAAPLMRPTPYFLAIDYVVAFVLTLDILGRALAFGSFRAWIRRPIVWLDLFVLTTLLFPQLLYNLAFLRVVRLWTLVHSDFFWATIGRRFDDTRVEDIARAASTLATFVFVVTGFVYTSFAGRHVGVDGYVDALYFTVTTLTTTGYGDVTLPGTWGKLISIVTMISGITLFLRLAQAVVRPNKVRFTCPTCGLMSHDRDAVYCKACGTQLNIPNDDE
jgi:voltage-gated potassium channel